MMNDRLLCAVVWGFVLLCSGGCSSRRTAVYRMDHGALGLARTLCGELTGGGAPEVIAPEVLRCRLLHEMAIDMRVSGDNVLRLEAPSVGLQMDAALQLGQLMERKRLRLELVETK